VGVAEQPEGGTYERVLVEHDPAWADQFAALAQRLGAGLEGIDVTIEHVGSTSVPGLAAKPWLDIDVVVRTEPEVAIVAERLSTLGYRPKGTRGIPGRLAFDQPPGLPTHALYVVVEGSPPYLDHVLLRDLLRRRPDLAARYEAVKRANAHRLGEDLFSYSDAKVEVIQELLRIARVEAGLPEDPSCAVLDGIAYRWRAPVPDEEVDRLHGEAFGEDATAFGWRRARPLSLGWVTAQDGDALVGFANVAWDGHQHAFLLDVAVGLDHRHRGIGTALVRRAVDEARRADCRWVHVDFVEELAAFYERCGFRPTAAGLLET
jgi:GrpB-like predicted nucleotidyltransferase (UPF0157 family)/predicted N-acetyltransferase YhbS